ncbi:tyrosine-type recombinase/integrase [Photobacterium atrarenae]|uniref:Site-specific integrase n=1 Tax=Photobacterium atrarenae TaxID=865757 RepID=A0ABY5GCG0_9GAMM|nr:site-specific integrase [Photobacterium atrarenae]UTV26394.1 site-specific integrase [Photobacterium atrarenae]
MSTKRIRISDRAIEKHLSNGDITRLRDERYALELRFHTSRESGSWYLVDKRRNNGRNGRAKWERLGCWPQLKASALFELLPLKLAQMATQSDSTVSDWQTFGDCLRWYLDHVSSSKQLSASRQSAVKSVITRHLLPALNELSLDDARKHHIKQRVIWPLQEEYELRTVKGYFAILKAAFRQAAREELLSHNPMAAMQFGDFIQAKAKPKEGKLHPAMVKPLFARLQQMTWSERMLVLMQLAHGTRISETRLARWCHIDWENCVWRIPASHTKTKETLYLPLTDQVMALLRAYQAVQPTGRLLLFPSANPKVPIGKDAANDIYQKVSQGEWTSHDCRKLARTRLADLGVDKFVGERLLNHKLSDLDQAYIHTTTESLKREALQTYHAWLDLQGFFIFHGKTEGRSEKQNFHAKPDTARAGSEFADLN